MSDEDVSPAKGDECYLEAPVVMTNNKSTFAPETKSTSSHVASESAKSLYSTKTMDFPTNQNAKAL
jgi:hypothetical protein